ncbi:MAG: PVC-type heme-binding CxxCH protein [Planctomycetota bacterium]
MISALLLALQGAPYQPTIAPASDEGRAAVSRIQVPAGFQVELWAAEPLLANPVALYPDRSGAVFVCETFRHSKGVTDIRDHMDWLDEDVAARTVADRVAMYRKHTGERFAEEFEREHERVRLVRDADGDGMAETSTVFADGFNAAAAGIGAGVLSWKGEVYYTCIPDLWKLRDGDGDGIADERRVLSTGYGLHVALLGHDLHGLRIGPDGKLYFSCGDRALRVETERGLIDNWKTGAVLRCDLDGTNLEVFATGLRNPQDLVFDAYGNLFTGDNNSDGGDSARWVHVVEGGDSGWRYSYQWLVDPVLRGAWNDEKLWYPHFEGQAAYLLPPVADFSHGPSGACAYPGTGFGDAWNGRFFLVDFEGTPGFSGVDSFRLAPQGASFELVDAERFAWRFCVTDIDFDLDGSMIACDWVDGWPAPGKGRIYRISAPEERGKPIVAETRALLVRGMETRPIADLARLLAHPDQRVRQEAHLELPDRGEDGFEALATTARSSMSLFASLHGIWGMGIACRRDPALDRGALHELLANDDAEIRAQAARVLGDLREPRATAKLVEMLGDPSPRARMYAAIGLGRIQDPAAVEPLFALVRATGETDPTLRHASIFGLQGCATTERLLRTDRDVTAAVRLAAVVALRHRLEPDLSGFLEDSSPLVRLEAARAIYDEPIAPALPALAGVLESPGVLERHLGRRVLAAAFALGGESNARALAKFAAEARQEESLRAEALVHLARWTKPGGRDPFMGEWRPREAHEGAFLPALVASMEAPMLAESPPAVAAAYVELAGESGARELAPRFTGVALDAARGAKLRAAAIRALAKFRPEDLEATLGATLFDAESSVRAASLASYQDAFPGRALPLLERALGADSIAERRVALQGLGRIADPKADELLLAALERQSLGLFPAELALDLSLAAEARSGESVKAALSARREARQAADEALASYLDCLNGGDSEKGRRVFRENVSLACLKCHVASDGDGGIVGPKLEGVGKRLSRLQLLESILDPNRTLSPGYEGVVFSLADDTFVEGALVSETPETVRVRKADGTEVELAASEITGRRKGLSAMPDGLRQFVSREDMRDLVEYLGGL